MYIGKMEYRYPDELPSHTSSTEMKDPQLRTSGCFTNVGMDVDYQGVDIPSLSGSIAGDDPDSGSYPMHKSLSVYGEDRRLACSRSGGEDDLVNPLFL